MLASVVGVGSTSCLPPDIDIAPVVNAPVTIDRTKLDPAIDPDSPIFVSCIGGDLSLEMNPANAVQNPDGDPIFSFWFVDFDETASAEKSPQRFSAPWSEPFELDGCDPKFNHDDLVLQVRLVVRDRPTIEIAPNERSVLGADVMDTTYEPDVSIDYVTFFVFVADFDACCLQDTN